MDTQLKVGDEVFLDIKRIGINGEGIGYYKKLAIFVDGVLPKENVLVKITKVNKGYATAELVELKVPSFIFTIPHLFFAIPYNVLQYSQPG